MNVPEGWAENAITERWGDRGRGREPQKSQMGEGECGGERAEREGDERTRGMGRECHDGTMGRPQKR